MKLQQLRYLCEIVRHDLNLSKAALSLHASQPGVSKQLLQLEDELGLRLFMRSGKRFSGLTEPGQAVLAIAQRIVSDAADIKSLAAEYRDDGTGALSIATTHTQARYALPDVILRFTSRYPKIRLSLRQGSPAQIVDQVIKGQADLCIATEVHDADHQLVMLPCYEWNRCIIAPHGHPLLASQHLSLEELASYPIITYDFAFTGRSMMNKAFEERGLAPDVVLTAIDADVIKTYVALGLGVGIIARMAFDPARDQGLGVVDASHLFAPSVTRIGIRRRAFLSRFTYDFIEMFAPRLARDVVDNALHAPPAA